MMPKQNSKFVHDDNRQLGDFDLEKPFKDTRYEGMSVPAALGLGLATFVIGAVTSTWVGAHILGYDD